MKTNNKIIVSYVRSNEVYDIFMIVGLSNEDEQSRPTYVQMLRNSGYTEQDILDEFSNS